jgi:hypothetical protein
MSPRSVMRSKSTNSARNLWSGMLALKFVSPISAILPAISATAQLDAPLGGDKHHDHAGKDQAKAARQGLPPLRRQGRPFTHWLRHMANKEGTRCAPNFWLSRFSPPR